MSSVWEYGIVVFIYTYSICSTFEVCLKWHFLCEHSGFGGAANTLDGKQEFPEVEENSIIIDIPTPRRVTWAHYTATSVPIYHNERSSA